MTRFPSTLLLIIVALWGHASAAQTKNVRSKHGGASVSELLVRVELLQTEVIPSLLDKIQHLQDQVIDLKNHRRMQSDCAFSFSNGVCQLSNPVEIKSSLNVAGNVTFLGDCVVDGNTTVKDLAVTGDLDVDGGSHLTSLDTTSNVHVAGALSVENSSTLYDLNIVGNLIIQGSSTFNNAVSIKGAQGDLYVTGNTEIVGQFLVQDKAYFSNDVIIGPANGPGGPGNSFPFTVGNNNPPKNNQPKVYIDGTLEVTQDVTLDANLEVKKQTTLDQLLTVKQGCVGCT